MFRPHSTFGPILAALLLAIVPCSKAQPPAEQPPAKQQPATPSVDLSPAHWDARARERIAAHDRDSQAGPKLAVGRAGMVATTSFGGVAVEAGLEALRQGGTAVDAALTTALTQIAHVMGSWTSYAGIFTMVVYDAETHQVYSLDASWDVPMAETDPRSIPHARKIAAGEAPGGRAVLVPGFMPGVEAAHDRFGVLPWAALFGPAIHAAEDGIEVQPLHAWIVRFREDVLARRPESLALFTRPDGELYEAGDVLHQPALAATLRAVAKEGARHMTHGPWAEKLVAAVRAEGGHLSLADLKGYRPTWSAPTRGRFGPYEAFSQGLPATGGVQIVEAMRLLGHAGLDTTRHYSTDAAELDRMLRVARLGPLLTIAPVRVAGFNPAMLFDAELDLSPAGRARPETTAVLWQRLVKADWPRAHRDAIRGASADLAPPAHSDAIVARDRHGNVVALVHSINTNIWGSLGLFIDGVSIADPGAHQQGYIATRGGSPRLPNTTGPLLVLRDGRPVVASAAVGNGLHEATVQNVANLLLYGMNPKESLEAPKFLAPFYDPMDAENREYFKQRALEGVFSEELLEALAALGQEIVEQPLQDLKGMGYWIGLQIDPESGVVRGGAGWGNGGVGAETP